ncbi:hypothetical protein ACP4OV_031698 [Aristida adscensionis]
MDEELVHIAVGKNFRKEKANILWAVAKFPRATIVFVHVHWPSKWMPFSMDEYHPTLLMDIPDEQKYEQVGGRVLYKFADEKEKEVHRGRETENMIKMLSQYKSLCGKRKVSAHYLIHDDTVSGVVNLIKKLKIKTIVIGSRNMSKKAMTYMRMKSGNDLMDPMVLKCSNDHLEDTDSIRYGGNSDISASIHELGDESDRYSYTTPPSDLVDEITDEEEAAVDDSDHLVTDVETLTEQSTDEPITYEDVEIFSQESADQSDEMQSFQNITEKAEKIMEKIDKLQKRLKELQAEGHNHEECILPPRQMAVSLKKKTLSKPRYPELQIPDNIEQFSMCQIAKATSSFHSKNLIGEGGFGPVYKGNLGGMPVAIKLLRPHGRQGFPEYQQEVVVLSRLEHQHIVRLIGVCPESCGLVYEHLSNGTLLDRLSKGLTWKDRVRILAEQRSALKYLHSSRPHAIIHADLKLSNILLDAGNMSRLGDFGTARAVHVKPLEEETISRRTNPMGTMGYMDPIFFTTGELTTESDVYAFGVVILQLLTGLLDLNIADQVREAIRMGAVHSVLDSSAGPWPEVQAESLLKVAVRCCNLERKRRPAITSDAEWRSLDILQRMATSSASRSWKWTSHAT